MFDEELVLISANDHPAIGNPDDLGACTLIAFASGCSYRKVLENWLGRAKVMPVKVLEFASYQAIIACVAAGTGIAIVPRTVLANLGSSIAVRQHELPVRLRENRTHLIWNGAASPALRGLLEILDQAPILDGRPQALRRRGPTLGIMPDYRDDVKGLAISGVTEGGGAAKAGLKAGDIITSLAGNPIDNIQVYMAAMAKFKPGDEIDVVVKRGKETLTLKVKLAGKAN